MIYTYDIFISYNNNDRQWAQKFAMRLKRRKFSVFFGETEIKGGESIPESIRQGLTKSRYVIPLLTPQWVNSEWCRFEGDISIISDPSARLFKIIPVLLKKCEIPLDFTRLLIRDFSTPELFEKNFDKFVKDLKSGLSQITIKELIQKQRKRILNIPILPWKSEASPSIDFLWNELFIEPHVKPLKHPIQLEKKFSDWINDYDWKSNIFIIGSPGIGKSITLHSMFLRLTDPNDSSYFSGLIISTNAAEIVEFSQMRSISLMDYLLSKIEKYSQDHILYKNLEKIILLVDGLDEVTQKNYTLVLEIFTNLINTSENIVIWISCRHDFFFRNVAVNNKWNSLFFEVLEILEWQEERDSLVFVSLYAKKIGKPDLYNQLIRLKKKHPEILPFLKNPFELTLLLHLLYNGEHLLKKHLLNSYTLYKAFYENWLFREFHRGTVEYPSIQVTRLHRLIAITLYSSKGIAVNLDDIIHKIEPNLSVDMIIKDSSFIELLKIREHNYGESPDIRVEGFWHETIGEFLVAEEILNTFKESDEKSLSDILSFVYNYEVNSFVRGAFETMNKSEREKIFKNFEIHYINRFSPDIITQKRIFDAIRCNTKTRIIEFENCEQKEHQNLVREQILYYIGRLPLPSFPKILRFAYYNEPTSLLRRIAALGAILHGDEDIESDYLDKLTSSSHEDIENRSVQLVYFGDVEGDIHTYKDDNKCCWSRTRNAIYERLKNNSQREMHLRWWDLRTLYLFYINRKNADPITDEEINILSNCSINFEEFSDTKKEKLTHEKMQLVAILNKLKPHKLVKS